MIIRMMMMMMIMILLNNHGIVNNCNAYLNKSKKILLEV
jgi:hypothetical protein